MTKHEEVYYTCNGCGCKLGDDWTVVSAANTDPVSHASPDEFDLCATCWLKVREIADAMKINAERLAVDKKRFNDSINEHRPWEDVYNPWDERSGRLSNRSSID